MTARYLAHFSLEQLKYVERLIKEDKDQDTCEIGCEILLMLSGLVAIDEVVRESIEVLPRASECSNVDWEFLSMKGEVNSATLLALDGEGWLQSDYVQGPPRITTFRRAKKVKEVACH